MRNGTTYLLWKITIACEKVPRYPRPRRRPLGMIHALLVVSSYQADRRTDRIVGAIHHSRR